MSTVSDLQLRLSRLTPTATLPRYATPGSAALDLVADEAVTLYPGERRVVATNIAIELPPGYEAQVRGRSGLSSRGFNVVLGTIDSDYRGGIGVICVNSNPGRAEVWHSGGEFKAWDIEPGQRIAQMVIAPVARVTLEEVAELSETARGAGGFGSTGQGGPPGVCTTCNQPWSRHATAGAGAFVCLTGIDLGGKP